LAARKNPGGGKGQDKHWSDAIRIAVNEAHENGDGKKLRALADKLVEKALEGDMQALREIGDRLDGKAVQSQLLDLSGEDEGPVRPILNLTIGQAETSREAD
jgi:hypothetical protein